MPLSPEERKKKLHSVVEKIQSALMELDRPDDAYFVLSWCLEYLKVSCKLNGEILADTQQAIGASYEDRIKELEQKVRTLEGRQT